MRGRGRVDSQKSFPPKHLYLYLSPITSSKERTGMTSKAATVDEYLTEIPAERREALLRIRGLCVKRLAGYVEDMRYGMPCYSRENVVEVAFASQKQNIALYILRTNVLNEYRPQFTKSAIGKGCIRYRNPNKIDFDMIGEMLDKTVTDTGAVC
jgi:uncharacterized protein YdhG (YjbR/CyaY superfamily)